MVSSKCGWLLNNLLNYHNNYVNYTWKTKGPDNKVKNFIEKPHQEFIKEYNILYKTKSLSSDYFLALIKRIENMSAPNSYWWNGFYVETKQNLTTIYILKFT